MESPVGLSPQRKVQSRGRPSLLSKYRPHGKFNSSLRHNQTAQTIFKTALNTVENFGLSLPVLVTETLTFADSNSHISVRLSPEGWGWVVCNRRLLIWQYRERKPRPVSSTPTTSTAVTCYELTLPQTDLAHKAELVCVFNTDGNQIPSCIGVSPEGIVRYWHSIAHDGSYIEKAADLHGQECDSLIDANPVGCILATTTCTVVLVNCNLTGGRHNIMTRTLQGSSGWLGGLGRRVSSLFFSAMPSAHSVETKFVGAVTLNSAQHDEVRVCVVAGLCAQLWNFGANESLAAEIDLQRPLRDAYLHAAIFPPGDSSSIDVHVLDMQSWSNGLLLFVCAVNTVRSPQMRHALAHFCTDDEEGAGQLLSFIPLQASIGVVGRLGSDHSSGNGPHMIATSTSALLYDRAKIIIVSSITPNDKPDIMEFNSNGDKILGAGLCYDIPLFFSKTHGVMSILSNDKAQDMSLCDSPLASPRPNDAFDGHLSLYEIDPRAVVEASENAGHGSTAELLKAAFLHHMRREQNASRALLNELFPPSDETPLVNSPLDRTVLAIATDLVNDIPASDPRWNQMNTGTGGAALGSSSSMQIGLQLQDKRRAFSLLLEFLRASGLWNRLSRASTLNAVSVPTVILLRSLAEQLTAALTLRALQQQTQHQHVVDTAIQQVMANTDENDVSNSSSVLSPSDLFYKNVSRIERALIQAVKWCNDQDAAGCAPLALSQLIAKVNQVIIATLQEVLKYRYQHNDFFVITGSASKLNLECTTWTSYPESGHLLSAICSQQALSARRAKRAPLELRVELRTQATTLASAILEFVKERTEYFPPESKQRDVAMKEYAKMRTEMIQPLVDDEEYEHACSLAEKFHDFNILVSICEKSNNRDKLHHYMNKFATYGFHHSAFSWFMKKGRGGQAALLKAFPHHGVLLAQWLSEQGIENQDRTDFFQIDDSIKPDATIDKTTVHEEASTPMDGTELLWLHELRADRYLQAADTLLRLSENETESVNRMMLQASLGKLCAYASKNDAPRSIKLEELIADANHRLLLSEYHTLPAELIAFHGLDVDNLRVMEPRDIVDMYITYSGTGLTEYDYSRALELCEFVTDADQAVTRALITELRRRVWCSTILVDSWDTYDKDSPISTIHEKMFFKVINAVHLMDEYLIDEYLIPLNDLLKSSELKRLSSDRGFQYLMKIGYEHVYRPEDMNI